LAQTAIGLTGASPAFDGTTILGQPCLSAWAQHAKQFHSTTFILVGLAVGRPCPTSPSRTAAALHLAADLTMDALADYGSVSSSSSSSSSPSSGATTPSSPPLPQSTAPATAAAPTATARTASELWSAKRRRSAPPAPSFVGADPLGDPGGCRWAAPPPSASGPLPPPPAFPPTAGVYPTHVRFMLAPPPALVAALHERLRTPPLRHPPWTPLPSPYHVSLSHTHGLPGCDRDAAVAALRSRLASVPPFALVWTGVPVVLRGGGRVWGGGVLSDVPQGGYTVAVRAVDAGLAVVGGGAFFSTPLPHVSIAWSTSPTGTADAEVVRPAADANAFAVEEAVVATANVVAATDAGSSEERSGAMPTWEVRSVVVLVGRRPHVLPLGGRRP